jgi:hypothetical protein
VIFRHSPSQGCDDTGNEVTPTVLPSSYGLSRVQADRAEQYNDLSELHKIAYVALGRYARTETVPLDLPTRSKAVAVQQFCSRVVCLVPPVWSGLNECGCPYDSIVLTGFVSRQFALVRHNAEMFVTILRLQRRDRRVAAATTVSQCSV